MGFNLGEEKLDCAKLVELSAIAGDADVTLSEQAKARICKFRKVIDTALQSDQTFYGINTGFGYLSDVKIPKVQLQDLQYNLIRSHACGVGALVPGEIVRGLLLLRAHTFALGFTGISLACVETILAFLQANILPAIPSQGSVGASGDLAPLAHLALSLIGEGEVLVDEAATATIETAEVLRDKGVSAHRLQTKEGLSLINGTHFMAVLAAHAQQKAERLARAADLIGAMSLDALRGSIRPFDQAIHDVRPHPGQASVARNIRLIFSGDDEIMESHKDCGRVQDPYSFRCMPQVHGASRDCLQYGKSVIDRELNSVTDNPLCFEDGRIISGGNFHGEPLAMVLDFMAIAVAELASISERRTEKLTNPSLNGGLPPFVARESGLSSGFMIPHVVAAALASENKVYAHPASTDTIPTSADKEDHVSMGPIAAFKLNRIIENTARIFAVEILTSAQGLDILKPLQPNATIRAIHAAVRDISPTLDHDRAMRKDIEAVATWILGGGLDQVSEHLELAIE